MNAYMIRGLLQKFEEGMIETEIKEKTIKKYRCDIERFVEFIGEETVVEKSVVIDYREWLLLQFKPATVISYLMTVNRFFVWAKKSKYCVKLPRVQKRYSTDRSMSVNDYHTLLTYAQTHKKWKYYCIMRTLAGTGIRVGELRFVTCEVLEQKIALISNKNKIREIYFTDELCLVLHEYVLHMGIFEGPIFQGREGKSLNSSSVWKTLKHIAVKSKVNPEVVYPHSFRHLFARIYMMKIGKITELADILGHSSLETTRIYTMGTI